MRNYRVFCVVATVAALAAMQVSVAPAWAKKAPARQAQASQQVQPQQTPAPSSKNCPGGVSKGCGPGSCRCP